MGKLKKISLDTSFLGKVVFDAIFQEKKWSSRVEKNEEGLKKALEEGKVDEASFVGWAHSTEGSFKVGNYKFIVKVPISFYTYSRTLGMANCRPWKVNCCI